MFLENAPKSTRNWSPRKRCPLCFRDLLANHFIVKVEDWMDLGPDKKIVAQHLENCRACEQKKWDKWLVGARQFIKRTRAEQTLNRRNVAMACASVLWADKAKIDEIYEECRRVTRETGVQHHVDHIIPLQGRLVCGLHVENNLRIITASENCSKHNKLDLDLIEAA